MVDANNQIEGVISKDALAASTLVSSASKSPQKHRIELLDFTLAVAYSEPSPDVRLHVNRFRIDWEGKEHKFVPKKKLKKNNSIKVLLDKVLQKVNGSRQAHQSARTSTPSAKSVRPEDGAEILQSSPLQDNGSQLFSQVPASQNGPLEDKPKPRGSFLKTSVSLLQHLNPFSTTSASDTVSPSQPPADPKKLAINGKALHQTVNHTNSKARTEREASIQSQTGNDTTEELPNAQPEHVTSKYSDASPNKNQKDLSSQAIEKAQEPVPENNDSMEMNDDTESRSPSRKRRRGSHGEAPISDLSEQMGEQSSDSHPSKKKQKTNTAQDVPDELPQTETSKTGATESTDQGSEGPNSRLDTLASAKPGRSNPWKWVGGIPLREVQIPQDQNEMLDEGRDRVRWIPSKIGVPAPQGHVPPLLLNNWNHIAKRRHQLASEEMASPERPVISTQGPPSSPSSESGSESSQNSTLPWSQSPPRETDRARRRIPADSSPLKGMVSEKRWLPSDEIEKQPKETEVNVNSNEVNHTLNPEVFEIGVSQTTYERAVSVSSNEGGNEDTDMATVNSPAQNARTGPEEMNEQGPLVISEAQNSTQSPTACKETSPPPSNHPAAPAEPDAFDSGDESDESMMDTSVPIALGGSLPEPSQSTQNDPELTSSGPSLPAVNEGHVQVFETPAVGSTRLPRDQPANELGQPGLPGWPLFSSQPKGTSSQSRVLNTDPFHENHEQTQSSNEESHSSAPSKGSVQVQGTQPQPLNQERSSQVLTQNQTQPEVVLDSSEPAQRHQNTSHPVSKSATQSSSHQNACTHQPEESLLNQPTHDSLASLSSLDQSVGSQVSPLARFMPAANEDPSLSKTPGISSHETPNSSQDALFTQNADLITSRLGYINKPWQYLEAQGVYERFRGEYAHYTGDFAHFVELCSKLQAIRAEGQMQRSFLWDDFIIMHLTRYPSHVEQRSLQETTPLSYEEYFALNHSRPVHRKRCLTLPAIDAAASQAHLTEIAAGPPAPPATQNGNLEVSFTASLVNQFSNFNAHSSHNTSPSGHPSVHIEASVVPFDFPTLSGLPPVDIKPTENSRESSVEIKREHSEESSEFLGTQPLPLSSYDPVVVKQESDSTPDLVLGSCIANTQTQDTNDIIMEDAREASDEEVDTDDDSRHETASVELGDETFVSRTAVPSDENGLSEAESEEENWFLALRRSRIPVPAWSDDPNTPFKRWAEQDQNVLSERRRRGGAKILLDAKGVIRRPVHR